MDAFGDLGSMSTEELRDLAEALSDEELEISYQRRILHGKLDIVRAELANRFRRDDPGPHGVREPRPPGPRSGAGQVSLTPPDAPDE